jgi:hypothetical protein
MTGTDGSLGILSGDVTASSPTLLAQYVIDFVWVFSRADNSASPLSQEQFNILRVVNAIVLAFIGNIMQNIIYHPVCEVQ